MESVLHRRVGWVFLASLALGACEAGSTPTPEKVSPSASSSIASLPHSAPRSPTPTPTPAPEAKELPSAGVSAKPAEVPPPNWKPIPAKRDGGFPGVEFAEVRGFAMELHVEGRPICNLPLDDDGTLCETVEGPGVVLSPDQTKRLLAILRQPTTFGGGAKCYEPHHAFVFYDKAGTPVADIGICFMCQMTTARPVIPIATDVGEFAFWTAGITDQGTTSLRAFCRELGLPKCDAKSGDPM